MDREVSIFSVEHWKARLVELLDERKKRKAVLEILELDWQNRYPRGPRISDERRIEAFEKAFSVSKRANSKRLTSESSRRKDKSRPKPL